ncbi:MAG: hypothetical protein LBK45_04650, partial [Tannerellaceae bacterium]|nr:hypothetical protein [Tannerellaceae bacterium]
MKALVFSGLSALIMMSSVSSCHLVFNQDPDTVSYLLDISFQDASGNDLVKGIRLEDWYPANIPEEQAQSGSVKHDLYVLGIIASQLCQDVIDSWNNRHYVIPTYRLGLDKLNGYWFLTTDMGFTANECLDEKVLTYKLKCPYVFGDEAEHEFVTYWEIPKIRNKSAYA